MPDGWDAIPGARGCTPQNCAIRDSHRAFADLGVAVYALSTQKTAYQAEMAERLHLPYPVLSDAELRFAKALDLPTFEADGMPLIRRLTLVAKDGIIERVFYPVFPAGPQHRAGAGVAAGGVRPRNLTNLLGKTRSAEAPIACQNFPTKR